MGVFSEIDLENNAIADREALTESPDLPVSDTTSVSEPHDGARQESEAKGTIEVLEQLKAKTAAETEEDKKRKAHEESEAKRKAEWEAKQRAKKEAEQMAWENAVAMDDEQLMQASLKRVGDEAERLTRRNMKQCVTEYIQTECLSNLDFARQVMHPRKSMAHCFRYIIRKAKKFVEQEMKDNDEKLVNGGYGSDVPDDLCYQWAVDYFMDLNAEEDKEPEEKFIPKPYNGKSAPKPKKAVGKKEEKKKPDPQKVQAPPPEEPAENQLTLFEVA